MKIGKDSQIEVSNKAEESFLEVVGNHINLLRKIEKLHIERPSVPEFVTPKYLLWREAYEPVAAQYWDSKIDVVEAAIAFYREKQRGKKPCVEEQPVKEKGTDKASIKQCVRKPTKRKKSKQRKIKPLPTKGTI